MNRLIFLLLGFVLCSPVMAGLPYDTNSDNTISSDELGSDILKNLETNDPVSSDLSDAAWIYWHWNGTPLTVTDTANQTITLEKPVHRLVAFDGSTLETLRSLNATDLIVGVSKNTHDEREFFPEFQQTPSIGTVWSPDMEALIETRPDTVFIYGSISRDSVQAIEEQLKTLDPSIRVLHFDLFRPEIYPDEVIKVAKILGKEGDAQAFLDFYEPVMSTIGERIASIALNERKTVYFESWNAYKSAAPGSGYHEKVEFAGGKNIFADATNPYPAVDPEAILRLKPEIVIKQVGAGESNVGGYNDPNAKQLVPVYESLLNRTGWNTLPAIQNGNIHVIHSDILGSASHFIGLEYLAKWFYPEKFSDIDPIQTHTEYLTRFQHLQYDPKNRGGFAYP